MEGLETERAVQQLWYSINRELQTAKYQLSTWKSRKSWLGEAFHHSSTYSGFSWISAFLLFSQIVTYTACHALECTESSRSLPAEIFFLCAILVFNLFLTGWDSRCRHREMAAKVQYLLQTIKECLMSKESWQNGHYPQLHMPQSPCISLQWTVRDGELVNLPVSLLVEGDVIIMRPGHPAPANCTMIASQEGVPASEEVSLSAGELYVPVNSSGKRSKSQMPSKIQFRSPLYPARFLLKDTPYIQTLRLALSQSLCRPVSIFNRERHTIIACYLERMTVPVILLLVLIVDSLHLVLAASPDSSSVNENESAAPWWEHLMVRPALAALPLLPLSLPLWWLISNACGVAYLLALVHLAKASEVKGSLDHFSEEDEEMNPLSSSRVRVSWSLLCQTMVDLLLGRGGHLWRTANLLQILGSVTAFCCIDKKGILSWPNPSAEKVFFLGSGGLQQVPSQMSEDNAYFSTPSLPPESPATAATLELPREWDQDSEGAAGQDDLDNEIIEPRIVETRRMKEHLYHPGNRVEVLDLTHNVSSDFTVQFDDPKWTKHINSLKPLGLSILLNTCNPKAQEHYFQFCDHITCESLHNSAAVPVMNKRCLCELAHQIGFTDGATDTYQLQQLLAVFRHVLPDVIQKGRFARSLNLSRLKMPFPYMSCAFIKDPHTGGHQLLIQGTGDLIVDACTEYWDGKGIATLAESDRKRILDFYHRSSLTAYCMAYAYAPLSQGLEHTLSDCYMELPPDCTQLFGRVRNIATPTLSRPWNMDETTASVLLGMGGPLSVSLGQEAGKTIKPCLSTDSLFLKEEEKMSDDESLLQLLSNTIFIGMVTMQYQACPDMVQFIELLEKSCIRFVHFSKENELRSRVFSEKMGLESGWNCHISLLNERNRTESVGSRQQLSASNTSECNYVSSNEEMLKPTKKKLPVRCLSAPSLVNLDTFTVHFEDEVSLFSNQQSPDVTSFPNHNAIDEDLNSCLHMLDRPGNSIMALGVDFSSRDDDDDCSSFPRDSVVAECGDRGTLSHSPSHVTDSTEQSVPVTFDMSNRAKLPKGIENIRPHLDHVDNVPLLVSLFTDCTPEASREMIQIMQEYGEVVCCMGSSANVHNTPIFLQADVSIAMEPLYPQLCRHQPVFPLSPLPRDLQTKLPPTELSRQLNSLPCAFTLHRNDPISLYQLILEARHFTSAIQNCFQFLLCCCLSLSLMQLLCALFFLPPPLNASQLIWLLCLQLPLLSLSLLGNPVDTVHAMDTARGKNVNKLNRRMLLLFLGCYVLKFVPTVLVTCFAFGVFVAHFCSHMVKPPPGPCWVISELPSSIGNMSSPYSSAVVIPWSTSLNVCQNIIAFLIVLYFVVISAGFVHRVQLLWEESPFLNRCWVTVSIVVLSLQCIFCLMNALLSSPSDLVSTVLGHLPFYVWIFTLLWIPLLVALNVCVKKHEIKVNIRQQKRARLEFGTKLGMNSPF